MSEYRDLVAFLRRNFPNAKKYKDRDTMNDGWILVKDMDAQTVMGNAVEFMRAHPYPPDIKELAYCAGSAPEVGYSVSDTMMLYSDIVADKLTENPPCQMLADHSNGTIGQIIDRYFPDPACDVCKMRGDQKECNALSILRRREKGNLRDRQ